MNAQQMLILAAIGQYILHNFTIEPNSTLAELLEELETLENPQ